MTLKRLIVVSAAAAAAVAAASALQKTEQEKEADKKASMVDEHKGIDIRVKPLIGGIEQYLHIRGTDRSNPVLLFIHGGPGSAMSASAYLFEKDWEKFFTVVTWDQRDCGLSGSSEKPLKISDFVTDAKEVAEYIKRLLPDRPIVILAHSWGTVVGSLAVHQYPDLFAAYIGTGQVVDINETINRSYERAEQCAQANGDTALLKALKETEGSGAEKFLSPAFRKAEMKYKFSSTRYTDMKEMGHLMMKTAWKCPDLTVKESLKSMAASFMMNQKYQEFLHSDEFLNYRLKDHTTEYRIPFFLIEGDHDWQTPYPIAREYYDQVTAPEKKWYTLTNCGHMVQMDNPEQLTEDLREIRYHLFPENA